MLGLVEANVKELIEAAKEMRQRLVLIVGNCGVGKSEVVRNLANHYDTRPINVNLELSRELLELTDRQRQIKTAGIMAEIANGVESEVIFFDNTEILFGIELKQDPLQLLQIISTNHTLVSSWNGEYSGNKLTYAKPSHCEYRIYDLTDTLAVSMNGN